MIGGTLSIMMINVPFSASIALRLRSVLSNDPPYKSATPLKIHKAQMPGTKKILNRKGGKARRSARASRNLAPSRLGYRTKKSASHYTRRIVNIVISITQIQLQNQLQFRCRYQNRSLLCTCLILLLHR